MFNLTGPNISVEHSKMFSGSFGSGSRFATCTGGIAFDRGSKPLTVGRQRIVSSPLLNDKRFKDGFLQPL